MRSRLLFILLLVAGAAPSSVLADMKDFIPVPIGNDAFLEAFTSYEQDNLRNDSDTVRWSDVFVREKLSLHSNGYSYHPRFLLYKLSLGGALKQEDYKHTNLEPQGWNNDLGAEYDARLSFLPEHPYNMFLFGSRYEPVLKEQSAVQHDTVQTRQGAIIRYRKKPYFLHTGFIYTTLDTGESFSDVKKLITNGQYFKRFAGGNELSFNSAVNPAWFHNSRGLDGNTVEYLLSNLLNLGRVRLDSDLSKNSTDQISSTSGLFESDNFRWLERLNVYLPWNFRTVTTYRFQEGRSTIDQEGEDGRTSLSDKGNNLKFDLIHRLYQSLDSTYTFQYNTRSSSGGKSNFLSNGLALNYAKSIRWGRVFAGGNLSRGNTESSGEGSDIINEPHSAISVPTEVFTLNLENVEEESILVFLRSPVEPFETILLERNVHYVVIPVPNLNTFEIQVYALPDQFTVPGTYDFFVSYSLFAGDFELQTDTFGANTSVELFNHLLTPYFSFTATQSDVLAGDFPGVPVDSKTYTGGLRVRYGPLRALGEYQDLKWDVSPYQSVRAEAQFVSALNHSVSVYGTASYLNKHHSPATAPYYTAAYDEETGSVSLRLQERLFLRSLFLSQGGSYSRLQGLIDTNWYSANASLSWLIGKLDMGAGVNAYWYDNESTTALNRRDHQYYYIRLKRQLF